MDESSSYYDFVQRLCEVVLENEVSVNLAYIAAVQAWWCRIQESMKLIQEKYKDVPCIKPWGYYLGSMERDQMQTHDLVVKSIETAIESSQQDWIETELHLLHAFFHWPIGEIDSLLEPIQHAKSLIDSNPLLDCFKPLLYAFEGMAKFNEGYEKDDALTVQRGQELAEVYDDALFKYMNMLQKANILRSNNVQDSLALFEDLYDLVQDLEVPYFICEVLNDSSIAFETTGEYDLAISSHHEILKTLDDIPPGDTLWILLSRIYATLGDGQKALEWINKGFEHCGHFESPLMYCMKAWALALLDRIDEAEQTLDTVHSLTIKSGLEVYLGNYYFISGVVELKKGDFLTALDFLEKAWSIAERYPRGTNENRILLDLARVEIALAKQSTDSTDVVVLGRWLSKLENHASYRNLLGIRMYAALLKSEFYQKHGQIKDALVILQDALSITDSVGVKTLRKKINDKIRELNQLLREEAVSSEKRGK